MESFKPREAALRALKQAASNKSSRTLHHSVTEAGYGASLNRLMVGLNRALSLFYSYHFTVDSPYEIESLFQIDVKQSDEDFQTSKKFYWDFWRQTWHVKTRPYFWKLFVTKKYQNQVRAQHQYPSCPLPLAQGLNRHQWNAVLAQAICGMPKTLLSLEIEQSKLRMGWSGDSAIVGIHVRRGDKNTECPYLPISAYTSFFKKISAQYFPNQDPAIFLTSDDPNCYTDFVRALPGKTIYWDHTEQRFNNCNIHMVTHHPEFGLSESLTAAKNICLLGQCDYVVGMATAQFTWIGGLLCVFRHNLDTSRHIMIDSQTQKQGHWATTYGYELDELLR